MCSDCERKDKVIKTLKESVVKNLKQKESMIKQARLNTITAMFEGVRYTSREHKQKVIQSLSESNVNIELVRSVADDLKRTQGLDFKHYH